MRLGQPFHALLACAALCLAARAQAPPSVETMMPELIRNFTGDQAAETRYEYHEHAIKDGQGRTYQVWFVNGNRVLEAIAFDERKLSAEELAAEHARALERGRLAALKPPAELGTLPFGRDKYSFAKLAADYVYTPVATRLVDGRPTWVYAASPNPRAGSRSREETVLLSSKGEVWVDAEDRHVTHIEVQSFEPVRYLLGLLTVRTARAEMQLARNAPGEWLPASYAFSVSGAVALFDHVSRSEDHRFSDFVPAGAGIGAENRPY